MLWLFSINDANKDNLEPTNFALTIPNMINNEPRRALLNISSLRLI